MSDLGFHIDASYFDTIADAGDPYSTVYFDLMEHGYLDPPARSPLSILNPPNPPPSLLEAGLGFDGNGWMLSDSTMGWSSQQVHLVTDSDIEGNEVLRMSLANAQGILDLGGEIIPLGLGVARQQARLTVLDCLLYTSPSPRDATLSRMPSSA